MYEQTIKDWEKTYSVKASPLAIKELLDIIQNEKEESFTIGFTAAGGECYPMEELLGKN